MNYAQDRSDRRIRYKDGKLGLWNDYRKALYGYNTTTNDQSKTGTSNNDTSSHGNNTDTSTTISHIDHELLGRTLRDIGWNYHALYHYGIVWDNQPYCSTAVGDYSQMAELVGYPEIGVIALYTHYYNKNHNDNNSNNDNNNMNSKEKDVEDDSKWKQFCYNIKMDNTTRSYPNRDDPQWIVQQHPPHGSDCGCGFKLCQLYSNHPYISKNIRLQQQQHHLSFGDSNSAACKTTTNTIVETVLQNLQEYCEGFLHTREKQQQSLTSKRQPKIPSNKQQVKQKKDSNDGIRNQPTINSNSSITKANTIHTGNGREKDDDDSIDFFIGANELLRQLSLWKVLHQRQKQNSNNKNTIQHQQIREIDKLPFTFLNSIQFQHIPTNLQFWKRGKHTVCNETTHNDHDGKQNMPNSTRTSIVSLEPLLQLLLLKLLYLVAPSLAIESIVGISIESTMMECDDHHEAPYFDELYFSEHYKSHWAYYVFLRALVLGERIKPHKYILQPYHHIPLWDTIWCINNTNTTTIPADIDQKKTITICDNDDVPDRIRTHNNFERLKEFMQHTRSCLDVPPAEWDPNQQLTSIIDNSGKKQSQDVCTITTTTTKPKRWHWFFPDVRSLSDVQLSSPIIKPLFVVGDSHVLSLAWQTISIPESNHSAVSLQPTRIPNPDQSSSIHNTSCTMINNNHHRVRLLVPVISTGLKAWHIQQTTRFFTKSCLSTLLQRIQQYLEQQQQQQQPNCNPDHNNATSSSQTIIVSAGEIDCREGMGGPLLAGYTSICTEHVQRTVQVYVESLYELIVQQQQKQNTATTIRNDDNGTNQQPYTTGCSSSSNACTMLQQILVLPVAPHGHHKQSGSRGIGRESRRETMKIWNTELRHLLPYKDCIYYLEYSDELLVANNNNNNNQYEETTAASSSTSSNYVLNPIFDSDSTHMNNAFLHPNIFVKAILTSGCNLDLL